MPNQYKAFIVVIVITAIVFMLAKRVFMKYMTAEDYARRRNVWLAITAAAFLLPNFWLFILVTAVIVAIAAAKEPNPAALYLFLLLIVTVRFVLVKQLTLQDQLPQLILGQALPLVQTLRAQALLPQLQLTQAHIHLVLLMLMVVRMVQQQTLWLIHFLLLL